MLGDSDWIFPWPLYLEFVLKICFRNFDKYVWSKFSSQDKKACDSSDRLEMIRDSERRHCNGPCTGPIATCVTRLFPDTLSTTFQTRGSWTTMCIELAEQVVLVERQGSGRKVVHTDSTVSADTRNIGCAWSLSQFANSAQTTKHWQLRLQRDERPNA